MRAGVAVYWVHRDSVRARPVSMPAPRNCSRLSPSLERASPSESSFRSATPPRSSFASNAARRSFDASATYPGSRPSSRRHQPASTFVKASRALTSFRPQPFAGSRRFTPLVGLQACFIPQPRPGPILFRGSILFAQPYYLVDSLSCPLAVGAVSLTGRPIPTKTGPRLRGFSPREGT
jgi:hypothetical protein